MDEKKQMNRRDFLKIVGISTVGATAAFYGCTPDKKKAGESTTEVPVGKMTYRQFPPNEDKGRCTEFGCTFSIKRMIVAGLLRKFSNFAYYVTI